MFSRRLLTRFRARFRGTGTYSIVLGDETYALNDGETLYIDHFSQVGNDVIHSDVSIIPDEDDACDCGAC